MEAQRDGAVRVEVCEEGVGEGGSDCGGHFIYSPVPSEAH